VIDDDFTRLLGDHLLNAKGFYDYGIKRGLTKPEDLRLTIEKRRKTARELVNGGMSQRDVAKTLGVSKGTIQNDLADNNYPELGQQDLRTACHAWWRLHYDGTMI
jgi:DNA invertase Pin-like site-specific DNA recombinase